MTTAKPPIDLRSDTVTRPDKGMYEAMTSAPLGDDVFGDDPTVCRLEERIAAMLGREAALFVPSGTMGNSIAIGVWARPGDEVLVEALTHSINYEVGGGARLWGAQLMPLAGERGQVPLEVMARALRPVDIHCPITRLLILEQTSNLAGGCVVPLDYLQAAQGFCREHDLKFHLDGARIFNASVASGVPVSDYAACVDSVMLCFSKGLGAPVGSALIGDAEVVHEARRLRKLLGGGMRQAGVLAAAALYALENNVERLSEDHARARELSEAIREAGVEGIEVDDPDTNMLYLRWTGRSAEEHSELQQRLERGGVLAVALGTKIRFVYHKDISAEQAAESRVRVVETLKETL